MELFPDLALLLVEPTFRSDSLRAKDTQLAKTATRPVSAFRPFLSLIKAQSDLRFAEISGRRSLRGNHLCNQINLLSSHVRQPSV